MVITRPWGDKVGERRTKVEEVAGHEQYTLYRNLLMCTTDVLTENKMETSLPFLRVKI